MLWVNVLYCNDVDLWKICISVTFSKLHFSFYPMKQVNASSLYIRDDTNRAILPEAEGRFSTFNLSNRMHYEVHGEPEQSQPPASRAPPPTAAVPSFNFMRRASSASTESAASHGTPRAGGKFPAKSFHRYSTYIMQLIPAAKMSYYNIFI